MSCIDHALPNPQEGRTPLMVASGAGHLPVAKLLLETHRSNVNEEDSEVSGWDVMGGISEQLPYAIVLDPFHMGYSKWIKPGLWVVSNIVLFSPVVSNSSIVCCKERAPTCGEGAVGTRSRCIS